MIAGLPMPAAIAAGALAGAATSLLFGVLALTFLTNQYAAGWRSPYSGRGFRPFSGAFRQCADRCAEARPCPLSLRYPGDRAMFFRFDPMVYLAIAMFGLITWFLYRTKGGLILRTIGESPETSHADRLSRHQDQISGGAVRWSDGWPCRGISLGRLHAALGRKHDRRQGLDLAGTGRLCDMAAAARPDRRLAVRGMTILQLQGQALGIAVPSELLSALPYLATIIVLVIISQNRQLLTLHFPASLAKPFRAAS